MPRLRRVSPQSPGWSRIRRGRGFSYVDENGAGLDPQDIESCRALTIPPAWRDVWICPHRNGHLQAVGVDDAGRRQYLYHPEWRRRRDEAKFDHVLDMAARLPSARRVVTRHIRSDGMPRRRTLAAAFRLLDHGLFRIGGEEYADENGGYGLVTLELQHVRLRNGRAVFAYPGKSGKEQLVALTDLDVVAAVTALCRRRGGSRRLLVYKHHRRWVDLTSGDVNDYLKQLLGAAASAKDFRTWHATVLAAVELARHRPESVRGRKRAIARVMSEVADDLGNTASVARSSYVDPRIVDLYEDGRMIDADIARAERTDLACRAAAERAVLDLLAD